MMNALKNPANRAWVVLIIATLITGYLGEVGAEAPAPARVWYW